MLEDRILRMEEEIAAIEGVQTARIRVEAGEITEVHVVASTGRRPKWIARDVVTTLFAKHGVRVPHQRVSVAASGCCEAGKADPGRTGASLVPFCVQVARLGESLQVAVEIRLGDRVGRSTREDLATRSNRIRLVALATFAAAAEATEGVVRAQLDEIRQDRLGGGSVCLVRLAILRDGREISVIGCGEGGRDRPESAAEAVLDALRRVIEPDTAPGGSVEYDVVEEEG